MMAESISVRYRHDTPLLRRKQRGMQGAIPVGLWVNAQGVMVHLGALHVVGEPFHPVSCRGLE